MKNWPLRIYCGIAIGSSAGRALRYGLDASSDSTSAFWFFAVLIHAGAAVLVLLRGVD